MIVHSAPGHDPAARWRNLGTGSTFRGRHAGKAVLVRRAARSDIPRKPPRPARPGTENRFRLPRRRDAGRDDRPRRSRRRRWIRRLGRARVYSAASPQLSARLIGRDPGGGAEVQRTEIRVGVRDGESPIREFFMQPLRRSGTLIAKDQPVSVGKLNIPKRPPRFRRKQPKPLRRQRAGPKRRPIGVLMHVQRSPVVHSRAA